MADKKTQGTKKQNNTKKTRERITDQFKKIIKLQPEYLGLSVVYILYTIVCGVGDDTLSYFSCNRLYVHAKKNISHFFCGNGGGGTRSRRILYRRNEFPVESAAHFFPDSVLFELNFAVFHHGDVR